MAGAALGFSCRCGALSGELARAAPAEITRVVCHCRDCRSAYTHLGLPDPGPVDLAQATQDAVRIDRGEAQLRAFRHSPRGPLRWYAACCGMPLFLTPTKARAVHVSVNADRLDAPEALGPVVAEAFVPVAPGKTRHKGAPRMVLRVLSRILARNLDGRWRGSPFFGPDGAPISAPHMLTRAERAKALAALGP